MDSAEEQKSLAQNAALIDGLNNVIARLRGRNAELERTNQLLVQLLAECREAQRAKGVGAPQG